MRCRRRPDRRFANPLAQGWRVALIATQKLAPAVNASLADTPAKAPMVRVVKGKREMVHRKDVDVSTVLFAASQILDNLCTAGQPAEVLHD